MVPVIVAAPIPVFLAFTLLVKEVKWSSTFWTRRSMAARLPSASGLQGQRFKCGLHPYLIVPRYSEAVSIRIGKLVAGIILSCQLVSFIQPAMGLQDGRIGLLYVGCVARSQPYWQMRSDPLFRTTFVQSTIRDFMLFGPMPAPTLSDLHRLVRLYMPRTLDDLVANYDVIVFFEANVHAVGIHIEKLARGVSDGGLGLLMVGGWQSFGGAAGYPAWGETAIGPLLPTEDIPGEWHDSTQHRIVIDKPENEFMKSIPWNLGDPALSGSVWDHNLLKVRAGAQQLARVVSPQCDAPLMVTWRLESGPRTFSLASEGGWRLFSMARWRYDYDFCSNLLIYLDDRPVPQDHVLVQAARSKIFEVATRRSMLMSLLDFCESFGANTQSIVDRLEEMEQVTAEALPHYLNLQFEDAIESYETAGKIMEDIEKEAMKLKQRALMWVYVIDWLTVTGTALFCGLVLWSLMVRRRLYRQVGYTRGSTR